MKFSKILNLVLVALTSKVSAATSKDNFFDNYKRADLFTLTDYNVPDIYINMDKEEFNALIYSASVNAIDISGGVPPPPPPPGAKGSSDNGPGDIPEEFSHLIINPGTKEEENLKITDASLKFVLNGETTEIPSISISIGGDHSRNTSKVSFNLKCNKGKLLGRKVFRLRTNDDDPSLMRSKISCDIVNHLGLPSISANYARLHINEEFMGLYVLMDHYKTSWIKQVYPDDKEVKNLYQCKEMSSDLSASSYNSCVNANDDYPEDKEDLKEFLETINAASNRSEIDDIMDVDTFIKYWILEWLLGSGDHMLINGKNYYLYKQLNGIWTVLYYDFDSLFGVSLNRYTFDHDTATEIPFSDWYFSRPIVDTLVKNDEASFLKNLQFIIDNAFNPDILFPHIDSIKNWIDLYILEDRTPVNGTLPGRINEFGFSNNYNYEQFLNNVEYTSYGHVYGIKEWIQRRYNFVCENYDVKCPNFKKTEETEDIFSTKMVKEEDEEEVTFILDNEQTIIPNNEIDEIITENVDYNNDDGDEEKEEEDKDEAIDIDADIDDEEDSFNEGDIKN
ncbi:hypothetical protein H8356DRAFT_1714992 [Neocallimastix lanati (nom. inval.)]|jgi:hypothetical protein|nr:hypothetical protein H8356DRAFT_1714992 [Neocallimastix sp. JGI-2020a]